MSRKFEQSFKMLLGRSARKLTYGAMGLALIFSALKGTLIYFGEMAFTSLMLLFSRNRALNLRRILAISSLTVAVVAMMELLLFRPPFSLFLMVPSITSLVLLSLSPENHIYVVPFIASAVIYSEISERAVIGSIILLLALVAVKIAARKLAYGEDPFFLFSAFIQSLFGDSNSFERVLENFSEEKEVEIPVFKISGDPPLLVVISNVHPGPFKNVGGAKLVKVLDSRMRELGYEMMFLHGVGGHENDPASTGEVEKIAASIEASLEGRGWKKCGEESSEPFFAERGDVEVAGFSFGKCPPILIISRKTSSMDDIPENVAKKIGDISGIIVDSQNKFDGEISWSDEVIEDIRKLIQNIHGNPCTPRIGYSSVPQREIDPSGGEIGTLGLRVLTVECEGKRGALIVIDGNNMKGEARKSLEDAAKSLGYDVVMVATTDNHENTGGAKGRGYRVVGETVPASLLVSKLIQALRESEKNSSKRAVEFSAIRVRIKVMGEEGFSLFQRIVDRVKYFEILLGIYLAIALVVSLMF
ncbi:MAG: DUF2070 family protein [Fervidicoccaceae archaeon]